MRTRRFLCRISGGKDLQTAPETPLPVLPTLKNEEIFIGNEELLKTNEGDVGMALVAIQGSNDNNLNEKGEPQGPSLHHLGGDVQPKPLTHLELVNIGKTYKRCIAYVERYHCFLEGHRNEFVYCLAMKMRKAGMTEEIVIRLLLHDYNYNEYEVRNSIKSVFGAVLKEKEMVSGTISKEMVPDTISPISQEDSVFDVIDSLLAPVMSKKPGREVYDQEVIEKLLPQWYETHYNIIKGIIGWRHAHTNEPFVRMTDYDENSISRRLYHNDQIIPITQLHNLLMSDYNPVFNVFKVYKDSLAPWDGVTDYIGQLIATVKTEDDEYWDFCMRKWYVAMAVGLVVDVIINHTVIVFVGAQGLGKTSWMKRLLPKEFYDYFGTAVMKTDSKDTAIQLAECALIIMDDFDNLNKKDLASYKDMITCSDVYIRRPYGRFSEKLTRIASFIGSCNHLQILTDTSGSRRYLCSKVVSIDYQHTVDINGCMAQAYALYESGFKYWFDQEEIRELDLHNEDFMAKSVEHELIDSWLRPVTRTEWKDKDKFMSGNKIQLMNAAQVMVKLMEKARITLTDNSLVKIGRVMSKAGFEKIKKNGNAYYMVRMLDSEEVDKNNRTFEVEDEEYKSLEEDLG